MRGYFKMKPMEWQTAEGVRKKKKMLVGGK